MIDRLYNVFELIFQISRSVIIITLALYAFNKYGPTVTMAGAVVLACISVIVQGVIDGIEPEKDDDNNDNDK